MEPSLEQLVLQVHLRDQLWRRGVDHIAHFAFVIGTFEVVELLDHGRVRFRTPFRVLKLLSLGHLRVLKLDNKSPANTASWYSYHAPLQWIE